jgi:cytoskeletal protein RodZ
MPTVGERLRSERERQRFTVHQVADATNIKTDHIRALEEGQWRAFSAPVYIRGFTRTYARYLRLDDRALVAELDVELGQTKDYAGPPSLVPISKGPLDLIMLWFSRVRWQWLLGFLLVVSVLGGVIWGVKSWKTRPTRDPYQGLGSGLHQPKVRNTGNTLPLPTLQTNTPPARR